MCSDMLLVECGPPLYDGQYSWLKLEGEWKICCR
jgi:hypothetical protein